MFACRADDADGIVDHLLIDALAGRKLLQHRNPGGVETRLDVRQRQVVAGLVRGCAGDNCRLLRAGGITNFNLEQKSIELCLRQRIGAFSLDRVLRGKHHERLREPVRVPFQRHLIFLHHFEQRALRFGGGAIDLVGEEHVSEDRPADDAQLARGRIEDRVPGDVGRHHVRGELHTRVRE